MDCSTMTWKSTSTLIPYASFWASLSVFCFRKSFIFFLLSSLFYFKRSISSKHVPFLLRGWLLVPSFSVWFTTGGTGYGATTSPDRVKREDTVELFKAIFPFDCSSECRQLLLLELVDNLILGHRVDLVLLLGVYAVLHLLRLV